MIHLSMMAVYVSGGSIKVLFLALQIINPRALGIQSPSENGNGT